MALRLRGATSGYIELKAPASAGDNTLTLPTNNGSANQLLKTDGSGNLSWSSVFAGTLTTTDTCQTGDLTVLNATPDLRLQDSDHTGNTTEHTIYFKDSTGANQMNFGSPNGEQHLRIKYNTTDLIKIQTDGKVGIGTTSPTGKLSVHNSDDANLNTIEAFNDNGNISSSLSQTSTGDGVIGVHQNGGTIGILLRSNGVSYLNGGNVGIGVGTTPTRILDVLAADGVTQAYIEKNSGSTNNTYISALTLSAETTGAAAANYGPAIGFQHCFGASNYAGCLIASQCDSDTNTAHLSFYPRNYGYSEALRIEANKNVNVIDGDLVIGTAGHGINFSATSGTGTSELLDDYEEGTFDVTFTSGTPYTNYNKLSYTKIGNQVNVHGQFRIATVASSGTLEISNLPFTVKSQSEGEFYAPPAIYVYNIDLPADTKWVSGYVVPGQTHLKIQAMTDNAATQSIVGTADGYIMVNVTYRSA